MRLLLACVCVSSSVWAAAGISVSPGAVTLGGQPFTLTVSFAGTTTPTLKPTMAVRWNGAVRPTTVAAGAGQLNAAIPASDIVVPGFAEITIVDQATDVVYQAVAWVLITPDVYASDLAY